jgi:hypothetical protein
MLTVRRVCKRNAGEGIRLEANSVLVAQNLGNDSSLKKIFVFHFKRLPQFGKGRSFSFEYICVQANERIAVAWVKNNSDDFFRSTVDLPERVGVRLLNIQSVVSFPNYIVSFFQLLGKQGFRADQFMHNHRPRPPSNM